MKEPWLEPDSPAHGVISYDARIAADTDVSTSSYASTVSSVPVESLEVHTEAPKTRAAAPMMDSRFKAPFSRRKAAVVSAIITVLVVLLTGGTLVVLNREAKQPDSASRLNLSSQDIQLKNQSGATTPAELQGVGNAVLINGDLITRGQLKVTNGAYVTVLRSASLASNQNLTLPNASGTLCTDSNNCGFATAAQLQQLQDRLGQIIVPAVPDATTVNGLGGAISIQGTSNQIGITTANGVIVLSTPQDIAPISSPIFANLVLSGNFSVSGTVTLPLDCSGMFNGGVLTTNASGQVICSDDDGGAGGGNVATTGGTVGVIPVFTAAQNVEDSIISQSGANVTIGGGLSVTGALSLGSVLTVANGGTGTASLAANGVIIGNGTGALNSVVAGSAGLCLVSTAGAPVWSSCVSAGSAVTSLNGLTGALTIANATGSVNTITIDDASTSAKGIASFNGTNFSVSSGAVNTAQNINAAASPTFAGVNTNNITPSGTLTVGASVQQLSLLGNASSTFSVTGSGQTTVIGFSGIPTGLVAYNFDRSAAAGTYQICTTAANCVGLGGGVTTSGGTANRLSKFTGSQTVGDSSISDNGSLVTILGTANLLVQGGTGTFGTNSQAANLVLNDGSSNTATIVIGGHAANRIYTIPDAGTDASFCLSTGNCLGGTGGAPNSSAYLVLSLDGTLTNERSVSAGSNISFTDAGANGNFVVATVQNPTFTTSVTTPVLQSSGVMTISSSTGNIVAIDAGSTIELQDNTNVTGNLDISGGLNVGAANAFVIDTAGAITAATGITSSGTVTFSALNCTTYVNGGALTTDASGQLVCSDDEGAAAGTISGSGTSGTVALFNGTNTITDSIITQSGTTISIAGDLALSTALTVTNGGTGATSFTANGLLYGNGTGALQVTAAGTSGQVVVANASGVPTFVGISGDLAVSDTGVATIQADSVALGTDTTGNYVSGLNAGTGTSVTGSAGEGWVPTVSVLYGSTAGTAAEGNTGITVTAGTNLTGGGSITLGAGGTVTLNVTNSPVFSGTLTVEGASVTVGTTTQQGSVVLNDGSSNTGTLQTAALGQNTVYTLPDPGAASATICLSTGNCAGAGGGITGSGTTDTIAKFTGTGTIGDSSISDNGTTVTINGTTNFVIQGGTATFGTTTQAGTLAISDGSSNTVSIVASGFAANQTYTLPDVDGAATFCMSTGNCVGGAGGGAPNAAAYLVASLDGTLTNERALAAGSNISLTDGGAGGNMTVATVQNPTFTTSVTTPLLQSSGVLTLTSASGQILAVDAGTTIELQDNTNVTGSLDVSIALNVGTTDAFQVNASGAIAAATGITSSGIVTFSALNCTTFTNGGKLTTNVSGQLTCSNDDGPAANTITGTGTSGTVPVFSGAQVIADSIITQSGTTISIAGDLALSTALTVTNGGTGATSFTANGLLYGNGTGALQVTAAGTSGQVVVANASGVPTFVSFSGDVTVSDTGATTIQANSVALGTDTTGDYVENLGTLTGLSATGTGGEGSTPNLSVTYGSGANTAVQGSTTLTCPSGTGNLAGGGTIITLGTGGSCADLGIVNNPTFSTSVTTPQLVLTGAGSNGILQVGSLGQVTTYTLPDPGAASATICLTTGNCTAVGSAGGDLVGSYPNPTIAKLQGGTLTITSVASGNILQYNGSAWVNQSISGDMTLDTSAVATIANNAVTSAKISDGTIANADLASGSFTNITGVGTLTGLTVTGATAINTSGIANTAIGNATGTFQLTSSGLNMSTAGALTGVTGITTSGGYSQSGSTANTLSGVTSFTAVGTALSVTNNATIGGALTVNTITPTAAMTVGATGQSFTLQGNAASTITATNSGFTTTLGFVAPTANTTINLPALPAGTYTLCTNSGNCAGVGATLQTAYDNSVGGSTPEIALDSTRGAVTIQDSIGGLGSNLFEVQNNGGSTTYFNVTASGINVTGAVAASGNINTTGGAIQTNSTTRIDSIGNLINIGTITTSGTIAAGTLGPADTATYLCRNTSNQLATCNTTGTGAAFVQGGNSFGAPAVLGTNDSNGLNFEVNDTSVLLLSATGEALFKNQSDSAAAFRIQNSAGTETLLNIDTISQTTTFSGSVIGPSASAYTRATNSTAWVELGRWFNGTGNMGVPDRIEIEITGGGYKGDGTSVYYIEFRDAVVVQRRDYNGGADNTLHTLKIYSEDAKAAGATDKHLVGFSVGSGATYHSFNIRARELSDGEWVKVAEATEPSTGYTNVTPTITYGAFAAGTVDFLQGTTSSYFRRTSGQYFEVLTNAMGNGIVGYSDSGNGKPTVLGVDAVGTGVALTTGATAGGIGTPRLFVENSTGDIGIGANFTSPNAMLHLQGTSTTAKIRVQATSGTFNTPDQTMGGLELLANDMLSGQYTPVLKFGSTDPQLTTTNPKFLAGIAGYATESYSADTSSGMGIKFLTTANAWGTSTTPSVRMTLDQIGSLGIGTTSPDEKLEVIGNLKVSNSTFPSKVFRMRTSGAGLDFESGGDHIFFSTWTDAAMSASQKTHIVMYNDGQMTFPSVPTIGASIRNLCIDASLRTVQMSTSGTSCSTSSLRYKTNVKDMSESMGLSAIMALRPVTYNYKTGSDTRDKIGFIAEEMNNVLPDLVEYDEHGQPNAINYEFMVANLTKAIQQQQVQINDLRNGLWNGGLVSKDTTFNSFVTFNGNVAFKGEAVFEGKVSFNGKITYSRDAAGTVVIPKGQISATVTFKQPYVYMPHIAVSSAEFVDIKIGNKTIDGFTVEIRNSLDEDLSIDWIANQVIADTP